MGKIRTGGVTKNFAKTPGMTAITPFGQKFVRCYSYLLLFLSQSIMDLDLRFSKPKNPEKNPDFKFSKISNSGIKILLETNCSDNFKKEIF